MTVLIWIGAGIALLGLIGILWVLMGVMRARSAELSEEEMRAVLEKAVPRNMAAFFLAAIGLMMVVAGIILS